MRSHSLVARCVLAAICGLALAGAGDPPAPPRPDEPAPGGPGADKIAVTTAAFTPAGGTEMPYTAAAGYMPLKEESGKLRARIFYVSYTAGATPTGASTEPTTQSTTSPATHPAPGLGSKRPLIFLFNGGPGAASVWLHLGAVGPRRLDVPADGKAPTAPYSVIDNAYSWLSAADLVFVDPVDTGYSRPADPEKAAKDFFGTQEDIASVGEFIRLYLTRHQRWASPIFLAGESYGTTRVSGLAPYLQEHTGVTVNGVILISTVLNFANLSTREGNDLPYPLYLPTYAALAWYHKVAGGNYKNVEDCMKDAESFALNEYTLALAKGASLSNAERKAIAKKLAAFTGLSEAYILECDLRIQPHRFEKELLRGQHKIIGRFDGRLTGDPTDPANDSVEYDPSLSGFYPAYTSAFNDYIRRTLKYENDLSYEVLSGRTHPWNYVPPGNSGFLYVGNNLRDAMTQNPNLKLLVCSGRYDLATPYFGTDYTLNHLNLAEGLRKNITRTYYPGGHMLYHVKENLESLHTNVATFIDAAK